MSAWSHDHYACCALGVRWAWNSWLHSEIFRLEPLPHSPKFSPASSLEASWAPNGTVTQTIVGSSIDKGVLGCGFFSSGISDGDFKALIPQPSSDRDSQSREYAGLFWPLQFWNFLYVCPSLAFNLDYKPHHGESRDCDLRIKEQMHDIITFSEHSGI